MDLGNAYRMLIPDSSSVPKIYVILSSRSDACPSIHIASVQCLFMSENSSRYVRPKYNQDKVEGIAVEVDGKGGTRNS